MTSLLFLRVTCPCSLRTYATLKFIRSSSSSSSSSEELLQSRKVAVDWHEPAVRRRITERTTGHAVQREDTPCLRSCFRPVDIYYSSSFPLGQKAELACTRWWCQCKHSIYYFSPHAETVNTKFKNVLSRRTHSTQTQTRTQTLPVFSVKLGFIAAKRKVLPKPQGPQSGADLRFISPKPDTSFRCQTADTWLVHRAVCLFTSQLSLVLIAPTHERMARLS